jgi:hypothetical protein
MLHNTAQNRKLGLLTFGLGLSEYDISRQIFLARIRKIKELV